VLNKRVTQSANGMATYFHKMGVGLTPKTVNMKYAFDSGQ
jgi:hypothetical protein